MPKKPARAEEPRTRRRRKDARPAELVAAALELFVAKGYAATRLDDVARKAGVAKGTVYLYFANKQALFHGVIQHAIVPEVERGEQQLNQHRGPIAELLRDVLADWMQLLSDSPFSRIPKLMASDADKFPDLTRTFHDAVLSRGKNLLEKVLQRGVERGEFRPMDIESTVEVLLSALWMPSIARHSPSFHVSERHNPQVYFTALIDLVRHGLLAPSQAPATGRKK